MKTTIKSFEAMADGSGAPAVIECNGFTWALDYLNKVRTNLIAGPSKPSRVAHKAALASVTVAYKARIAEQTPEWLAANKEFYK